MKVQRRRHPSNVHVPKSAGSAVEIEVSAPIAEQFAALGEDERWLFARPDSGELPDDRDLQQHVIRPAAEAAGCYFAGFGMHTFRPMKVSWSQQAGETPMDAMHLGRHASLGMTLKYTVLHGDRRKSILDGLVKMSGKTDGGVQ